jgi:hypothetical protein
LLGINPKLIQGGFDLVRRQVGSEGEKEPVPELGMDHAYP